MSLNISLLSGLTCDRNEAVRTNWPTVLAKLPHLVSSLDERCHVVLPCQERIEREVGDQHAIDELNDPRQHEE
jgi:hypothetical protein